MAQMALRHNRRARLWLERRIVSRRRFFAWRNLAGAGRASIVHVDDLARLLLADDCVGHMAYPDWMVSHGQRPSAGLWRPLIPTREGLKATAQWYRENKCF